MVVILVVLTFMAVIAAASWRGTGDPDETPMPPSDPYAEACLVPADDALAEQLFRGAVTGAEYRSAVEALAAREVACRPFRVPVDDV